VAATSLTPEEFELHLKDLRERLCAHLERGEGEFKRLCKEAEELLALRGEFPDVSARYEDVEGLVAEMLARRKQRDFMASSAPADTPGCLLGWLARYRKK